MATPTTTDTERKRQFVDASIAGIHAHQIALQRKEGKGTAARFAFRDGDDALHALTTRFTRLTEERLPDVLAWIKGGAVASPDARDESPTLRIEQAVHLLLAAGLEPGPDLPFSVLCRTLASRAPQADARAVRALSSLHQIVLQVSLDALEVQRLFPLYMALELPVGLDQLGLVYGRDEFVALGAELAPQCCACPFDTSADAWHLVLRKIQNWSERFRGTITAATYARELLPIPEVRACAAGLRLLPQQKICVLGHSFTMSMHWASQGSFTDIAYEIIRHHNPHIQWVRVNRGGLTPSVARRDYLESVLQHHPDQTIMVTISRNDENRSDLKYCIKKLQDQGSKVIVFDCVMVYPDIYETEKAAVKVARAAGAAVVEVYPLLAAHPKRAEFPALDEVHTTPPYHKFMAVELVKYFAGRRGAALPA